MTSKGTEMITGPPVSGYRPISNTEESAEGIVVQNQVQQPQVSPAQLRRWRYGLCVCCSDCNSCLESWCCFYCQLSRQYNMNEEKSPTIHWPITCGLWFCDACVFCFASTIFQFVVRRDVRKNLNIKGSDCDDAFVAFCCGPCGLQQSLKELSDADMFPGACCYDVPSNSVTMQ